MPRIKFNLVVKNSKDEWKEPYENKPGVTSLKKAEAWGRELVDSFNRHLRPMELPREFVRVEPIEPETNKCG